ncbi:helix-turn-helix domain-containing protein [Actinoplanes sp. ATCC 53533]|uniref:helix-turn-helix domain-containing protein n=1 Tax=Actinoplanes sp. ATCC 53533 TaxID=1288362 RepID=UPI0018F5A8E7|nr:helix-turn-helix domain-containing protein [Actinoplanes sp. ATCC 53533]
MWARVWLTTGEAAVLLRSSRVRVADLCLRGLLPYVTISSQRRIRRCDVEALIAPGMSRAQLESLWLHRAVAGRLVRDPRAVLAAAAINLRRLRQMHPEGRAWEWLDRWDAVLDQGAAAVLETLTSSAAYAVELREASPFAGILPEDERRAVLAAFAESRRDRARLMPRGKFERVLRSV